MDMSELAQALGEEASYYWDRHRIRFEFMATLLQEQAVSPQRILDIGMGFQTCILADLFPQARIDCMGVYEDQRFKPGKPYTYFSLDLNDVIYPDKVASVIPHQYDLIVFMEVLEHLYTAPSQVIGYLTQRLNPGGLLLLTTPNAAWLKNRIKFIRGKQPFEMIRENRSNMGHIREYTAVELASILEQAGLKKRCLVRRGLYSFDNRKDRFYSWLADRLHPSLSRSMVALYEKPGLP